MHPIKFVANQIKKMPDCPQLPDNLSFEKGICAITGEYSETIPRRHLLGKSFTDGQYLISPNSNRVSIDAWIVLKYKWTRMSSWICNEEFGFKRLNRSEVRDIVLNIDDIATPWCAYCTTSYKKHGIFRVKISTALKKRILFEMRMVDLSNKGEIGQYWHNLNTALRAGIPRSALETLNCPPSIMRKVGLGFWMEFYSWAQRHKNRPLYAFLCYLLPSKREMKNEQAEKV